MFRLMVALLVIRATALETAESLITQLMDAFEQDDVEAFGQLSSRLKQPHLLSVADPVFHEILKKILREYGDPDILRMMAKHVPSIIERYGIDPAQHGLEPLHRNPIMTCVKAGQAHKLTTILALPAFDSLSHEIRDKPGWTGYGELANEALDTWNAKVWFHNGSPVHPYQDYDRVVEVLLDYAMTTTNVPTKEHVNLFYNAIETQNLRACETILKHQPTLAKKLILPNGRNAVQISADVSLNRIQLSKILTGHQQGLYHGEVREDLPVFDALAYVGLDGLYESLRSNNSTYDRDVFDKHYLEWSSRIAVLLIKAGSSPFHRDKAHNSLLHVAALAGNHILIKILLDVVSGEKLHINDVNSEGHSPLDIATMMFHEQSAEVLSQHGAKFASIQSLQPDTCIDMESCQGPFGKKHIERDGTTSNFGGGGHWSPKRVDELDISYCDFEIVEDISMEDLYEQYIKFQRPVIVRNRDLMSWAAYENWDMMKWNDNLGDAEFRVYEKIGTERPRSFPMTFAKYFEYMEHNRNETRPLWMHDTIWPSNKKAIFESEVEDIGIVTKLLQKYFGPSGPTINNFQFMVAPRYSGSPAHFHHTAANLQIHGRKRWFLFPPGWAFYSTIQVTDWLESDYPKIPASKRPFECVQEPGDLFVLPEAWGHATVSIQDTIAYALLYTSRSS